MAGRILVGTSSWADPEFVRDWYPPGLPARARLGYHAQRFELVEVNSTFYQIPPASQANQWVRETPEDFVFDVKLHRLFSRHRCEPKFLPKPLQSIAKTTSSGSTVLTPDLEQRAIDCFLEALKPLETTGKLGALLLQFSPSFSPRTASLEDLEPLIAALSPRRIAIEFRNRNWLEGEQEQETISFLKDAGATLVSVDAPKAEHFTLMPAKDQITNPHLAYLRLHGRDAHAFLTGKTVPERFDYLYNQDELFEIKERAETLAAHAEVLHVLFNNNRSNYAPKNAAQFRHLLQQASDDDGALQQGTLF
jgi:uncharacterized protein YecE (DUF72 family)